jgi:hypothetical protein
MPRQTQGSAQVLPKPRSRQTRHSKGIFGIDAMTRALLSSLAVAVAGLCSGLPAIGQPAKAPAATPAVPAQLQPPAPSAELLRANARGSQIYVCAAKPGDGGFAWSFKAPDAVLAGADDKPMAKHYAGPTWEAGDGSKVVGEAVANVPAPEGKGVPWLLLKAKSHEGTGQFAAVSYIQRLDTMGGAAPSAGCDAAHVGQEQPVPYTAIYVFYRAG